MKLELGPYEEDLRCFLMGGNFPTNAVLILTVSSSTEAGLNHFGTFPFLKERNGEYWRHRFVIPGITFQMFTGKGIRGPLRKSCAVRSPENRIYTNPIVDEMNLKAMAKLAGKAREGGNLKS